MRWLEGNDVTQRASPARAAVANVVVVASSPLDDQVAPLLVELDAYLYRQYPTDEFPPEINHILEPKALAQPSVTFLVAWALKPAAAERTAVGCGAVRRMTNEAGAYGEIKRMFVKPEARGQRIAEQILMQLESVVLTEGIRRVLLETGTRQPEAQRLYARCGYTVRGGFGGYSEDLVSVFMEKAL